MPFEIVYFKLPSGREPVLEFRRGLRITERAAVDQMIDRLREYGTQMSTKFITKVTDHIFELRIKSFDSIFRVFFFYQPGRVIVLTNGYQKKGQKVDPKEVARAEEYRKIFLRYRNQYPPRR